VRFVTTLALAVAILVVAPYLAHRLRRRRADERPFAPARLVPPAPPRARRKSALEDRALFAVRALAVVALAALGASPLVRCSRLSLQRDGGASVALALVLDDSMSMRAPDPSSPGRSRFERARRGARELLASAREGDAVAIVLAGAPARVALAATSDLATARSALDTLAESDRATDLDGATSMARALVAELPQVDKRIVLLSDLADGHPDAPPVGEGSALPLWAPLAELRADASDCGILAADRSGPRVRVRIACSKDASAAGREVTLSAGDAIVVRAPAPAGATTELTLTLPGDEARDLVAVLGGRDAIASDDRAPVVVESGTPSIAVVADSADESVATGGAPVVEQAMAALRLDVATRPIPAVPDRQEDLTPFVGLILDDPPGLTPEQRRAVAGFLEQGGAVLLAVGPRGAAAPLGATLEPMLSRAVTWSATPATGATRDGAVGVLAEAASSLMDLGARERATLAEDDVGQKGGPKGTLELLLAWNDGAPLVARRTLGRGAAWIVTLPFAVDSSDLTLRPGFLALLDGWVTEARQRAAPRRTDVGEGWSFGEARSVSIVGPGGAVPVVRDGRDVRAAPPLAGVYRIDADGEKDLRVAAPIAREIDFRPRRAASTEGAASMGDTHASVDASPAIALALLALVAGELALRAWRSRRLEAA
jgi:hypothetical protein